MTNVFKKKIRKNAGQKTPVPFGDQGKKSRQGVNEVLCGIHPVLEALKVGRRRFYEILIAEERSASRMEPIVDEAKKRRISVAYAPGDLLDEMSLGVMHQGVVATVSPFSLQKAEALLKSGALDLSDYAIHTSDFLDQGESGASTSTELPQAPLKPGRFYLILEGVEDPHNFGAIIRTALSAGVDRIFIPKDRAVHPSPSVSRASAGAMEHADILVMTNTANFIKGLKKKGIWIAGLDAKGRTSLFDADFSGDIALVIGGEHRGIRPLVQSECDFLISLPMVRGVDSLNASVAAGIAMYEVFRQRAVK